MTDTCQWCKGLNNPKDCKFDHCPPNNRFVVFQNVDEALANIRAVGIQTTLTVEEFHREFRDNTLLDFKGKPFDLKVDSTSQELRKSVANAWEAKYFEF